MAKSPSGTIKKIINKDLIHYQERYESLIEASPDGIATVNKIGIITFCNTTFLKLTGYSEGEIVGKHISKLPTLQKKDIPRYLKLFLALLKGRNVPEKEFIYITKSGETRFGKAIVSLIKKEGKVSELLLILRDITDEKNTEKALEETERKFRQFVENTSDIILRIRVYPKLEMDYISPSALKVLGYSQKENYEVGDLGLRIVHPDDKGLLDGLLKGKHDFEKPLSIRFIHKKGNVVWLEGVFTPEYNKKGRLEFIDGIVRDITERKKAEADIDKEKDKTQNYLDIAGSIIVVIDTNQKVNLINRKGCEVLGYKKKEIIGKNWFDNFLPEDTRSDMKKVFNRLISGGIGPVEFYENNILTKNGEEKTIAWHNTLVKDEKGDIVSSLSSGEDITKRKHAESEVIKARMNLDRCLSDAPIGVLIINKQGMFTFVNPAFLKMTGFEEKDIVGKEALKILPKFTPLELAKVLQKRIDKRLKIGGSIVGPEIEILNKKGIKFPISYAASGIKDEHGITTGVIVFLRDISERKKTEKKLQQSEKRLQRFSEVASEGIVYHDNGIVIDANRAASKMFGIKHSDLIGINAFSLVTPGSIKIAREKLKTGSTKPYEIQLQNLDGTRLDVEVFGKPVYINGKKIRVTTIHDITERKKVEKELQESEHRYRTIFDSVMVSLWEEDYSGVFTMLEDLKARGVKNISKYLAKHPEFIRLAATKVKVLDINDQTLKMYGAKDKASLMGSLNKIFVPETFEKFGDQLIAMYEDHPYFETEFLMHNIHGESVHALGALRLPTNISQAKRVVVSLVDITERKKTEKVIESLSRFPSENPNPVIRVSDKFLVLYANEHGKNLLRKLKYKKGGKVPKIIADLIIKAKKEASPKIETVEVKVGNLTYGLTLTSLEETDYINIYGKDITIQKKAEADLKKKQERKEKIINMERARIERDLHDSVSQMLFSTRLIAEVLPDLWEKDREEALKQLEKIGILTKESHSQMRRLLLELRPGSFSEEDLTDLIRQLGQSANIHLNIPIKINIEGKVKKLSSKVKEVFYRICQEALNNCIKHSGASKINIALIYFPEKTYLKIEDNGHGFEKMKISHKNLGIYIMTERAESINASLNIESGKDKGTRIILIYKS